MDSDSDSDTGPLQRRTTQKGTELASDSDEEDNILISSCRKKRVAILDDSDDEDGAVAPTNGQDSGDESDVSASGNNSDTNNEGQDVEEPDGDVEMQADPEDSEDEKKSTAWRDSDSEDESDAAYKSAKTSQDSTDAGTSQTAITPKLTNGLASDLFDAEMDSDDDGKSNKSSNKDSSDCNSSDDEERNQSDSGHSTNNENDDCDTGEVSAALKRRLQKGAGKKANTPRGRNSDKPHRPSRDEIQDLHSESQRLVRESSVKLPYHKPDKEKLGLSVFLARCKQKQEQLDSIKKLGPAWKHTPEPQTQPKVSLPPRPKTIEKLKSSPLPPVTNKPNQTEESQSQTQESQVVDTVRKDILQDLDHAEEDWDNLPDLTVEKESANIQFEVVTAEEAERDAMQRTEMDTKEISSSCVQKKGTSVTKEAAPTEQESGYISVPTSEEENSGDNIQKTSDMDGATSLTENKNLLLTDNLDKHDLSGSSSQPTNTPIVNSCLNKTQTHLTPKLASLTVENFTPKLSGAPDSFIDFDEDEDEQKTPKVPSGVVNLMERVIKHSAKHTRKKSKEVEISLVSKEAGEARDELKLKKLTYHIEEKEEEPESQTPGAKLLQLKEKLKERMKQKREESRQKREEQHAYENEEGFGEADPMDDEAELTDQTDTDDDEAADDEEMFDEEEDLIGGHGDEEEEEEKENNPFVDDEADEDDEEDEEMEESLHLELENDEQSQEKEDPAPRKDFLKSALKKTNTLELFDEDANTESPTMSQNSNGCLTEVSSRPFQQLSGTSNSLGDADQDDILMLDTQPPKHADVSSLQENRDKDTSLLSADSSFEMMGSYIPAGQRMSKKHQSRDLMTPELLTPSSKSSATAGTGHKMGSRMSDLTMPIEDSQDLLTTGSPSKDSVIRPSQNRSPSYEFQIEETQSLMLDEEGLFKVRSVPKPRRQLLLDHSTRGSASVGTEDELLGLCSGKFTGDSQHTDRESHTSKSLFGDSQSTLASTQNNMDELLGLCSGRFSGPSQTQGARPEPQLSPQTQQGTGPFQVISSLGAASNDQEKKQKKRKRAVIRDEDSGDSFEAVGGGEEEEGNESDASTGEGENDPLEDEVDSDDEEMQQLRQFRGFADTKKPGKIHREFVDEEAELSGSEYDSDENFDIAEKDDILEMEAGDMDDVGTEEQLRDQVNRVHLKSVIDADKKELRLFQEMYLQDGDLHTEGGGRTRKFRWRNIDDEDTQEDMFAKSDEEDAGGEDQEEQAWRVKRFEREKFLMEQKAKAENDEEVIKLGKVVFKPKKDKSSPLVVKENVVPKEKVEKVQAKESSKENFTKPKLPVHGSFLRRSRDALAKLAEMTKPMTSVGGARNSGMFVFSSMSAEEKAKEDKQDKKRPQVKRSMSSSQQPNKRPRLEKSNSIPANSIFNHM